MEEINVGEIVYATISLRDVKNKFHDLRKVVFSREWNCNYPHLDKRNYKRFLSQNGLVNNKGDIIEAEVIDVKILARTGFKNRATDILPLKRMNKLETQ